MPPSTSTTSSPLARNRTVIFSATGSEAAKQVTAEQARLEALFQKAHKRALSRDVLYVSSWGPRERTTMGLTAVYTPEQADDVAFLRTNASASADAAPVTTFAGSAPKPAAVRV